MVHIVQCLCPSRHTILAFAYEPGITTVVGTAESRTTLTLDEGNASEYLRGIIADAITLGIINPWCGLCQSRDFHYEDGRTKFATIEEAQPFMAELERQQSEPRALFGENSRLRAAPGRKEPGQN